MNKNDGGTAFPMQDPQAIHAYAQAKTEVANAADVNERDQIYLAARAEAVSGMSLRDYFAAKFASAQATATSSDKGLIRPQYQYPGGGLTVAEEIAKSAYELADAMLAARVKP